MNDKDRGFEWEGQIKRIQYDINNPNSSLNGKILTKLDFWLTNKKHVWRKTIARLPCPLDPSKTVDEMMIIYKYKNHVTLIPRRTFKVEGAEKV